jgi:hypothetical protein
LISQSPAPSQYLPTGADFSNCEESLFVARISIPLNIHPKLVDAGGQGKTHQDT